MSYMVNKQYNTIHYNTAPLSCFLSATDVSCDGDPILSLDGANINVHFYNHYTEDFDVFLVSQDYPITLQFYANLGPTDDGHLAAKVNNNFVVKTVNGGRRLKGNGQCNIVVKSVPTPPYKVYVEGPWTKQ